MMKNLSKQSLFKLLLLLIVLALIGPYIIVNIIFRPTAEQLRVKHFKKASIYQPLQRNDKKGVHGDKEKTDKNNTAHFVRVPGGVKSLDIVLPEQKSRWGRNSYASKRQVPLYIPFNNTCTPVNYTTFQTESYCLQDDDIGKYFTTEDSKRYCYKPGTESIRNGTKCVCRKRWHGSGCSMPDFVYRSTYPKEYGFRISNPPRRLIHVFPFASEFDLLETRFHELGDLVDLYVIVESNYTAAGQPKPRALHARLLSGAYPEHQHRILYVPLLTFPRRGYYDGWAVDALLRNHAADAGLARITNLRADDVMLLSDADEVPRRELVAFLKLHAGYPEPVGMYLSHNVYGFQWLGRDILTHVYGACSMSMLAHVFDWQPYSLRAADKVMDLNSDKVAHYRYKHGGRVRAWSAGNGSMEGAGAREETVFPEDIVVALEGSAGWHCSWCFPPAGIKAKLEAAHWSDLPRWGAYPSKTSEDYISNLTRTGMWFDDRTELIPSPNTNAPQYVLQHPHKFPHLFGTNTAKT